MEYAFYDGERSFAGCAYFADGFVAFLFSAVEFLVFSGSFHGAIYDFFFEFCSVVSFVSVGGYIFFCSEVYL